MIDVETIGSRSDASEMDIELRKRSRAPRTVTSMPVISDVTKIKGKGIDIRGADHPILKKEVCEGRDNVGSKINKPAKDIPAGGLFDVDFTKYSVGASESAKKQPMMNNVDRSKATVVEPSVQVDTSHQYAPQTVKESTSEQYSKSAPSKTTNLPKDTSGNADINQMRDDTSGLQHEAADPSKLNFRSSYHRAGCHVFVPSIPPRLAVIREIIDQLRIGATDNAATELKKLMVAHEQLTENYMKSIEEIKRKDSEINDLKNRCITLEDTANEMAVRLKNNEGHLERSETRVGMLLCLLDESRANASELEKRCSAVDVADTVHSIIKTRSMGKTESDPLENSGMPSFDIHVTQMSSKKHNMARSSSGVETDERVLELEVDNEKLKVAIEVLQHTNYDMMTQKDQEIQVLIENNNRLEEEAERWRRGMDNAKGEADHVRSVLDRKKKDFSDLSNFSRKLMDELVQIQSVNDELTIINRTFQSEMKENEPSVPIPKLEPEQGSIARGVVERGARGRVAKQDELREGNDKKRKDIGVADYASLNEHHTRRTRRSVSSITQNRTGPVDGNKLNPVDIDEIDDGLDVARTVKPRKQFNINKTSIAKHLDDGTKMKLQNILTDKSPGYV